MSDAKTDKYSSVGCPGQITYVEFGGAAWTVAVSVAGGTPVTVKVNSALAPAVGDRVRIDVAGQGACAAGLTSDAKYTGAFLRCVVHRLQRR